MEKEYQTIVLKIEEEKQAKKDIEAQINEMKELQEQAQKLIAMQQTNDFSKKLMLMDQRNCMQSAVNYTTHCDF
jgi:hypothetical protein